MDEDVVERERGDTPKHHEYSLLDELAEMNLPLACGVDTRLLVALRQGCGFK
jgi:hypothetical protein